MEWGLGKIIKTVKDLAGASTERRMERGIPNSNHWLKGDFVHEPFCLHVCHSPVEGGHEGRAPFIYARRNDILFLKIISPCFLHFNWSTVGYEPIRYMKICSITISFSVSCTHENLGSCRRDGELLLASDWKAFNWLLMHVISSQTAPISRYMAFLVLSGWRPGDIVQRLDCRAFP